MATEWQHRIDSIVRRTRANLDAVSKDSVAGLPSSSLHSYPPAPLSHSTPIPPAESPAYSPMMSGSTLFDKMGSIEQVVLQLQGQVKLLLEKNEEQDRTIASLNETVGVLENRLSERGVDIRTESKLERMNADVTSKLLQLETQLRSEQLKDRAVEARGKVIDELSRELRVLRQACQSDIDHLERELAVAKATLLRHESDVSAVVADNRIISQRHEELLGEVRILDEKQRNQVRLVERCLDDEHALESHFRTFRAEMRSMGNLSHKPAPPAPTASLGAYQLSRDEMLKIRPSLSANKPEQKHPESDREAPDTQYSFSLSDYNDIDIDDFEDP